jgi:hypothetical protein
MTNRGIAKLPAQILIMASIIIVTIFSGLSPLTFAQSNHQENISPVITVKSPIEGQVNQRLIINTSISDPDGNVTLIIWNQESEYGPIDMNISQDKRSMSFTPTQNVTYVFSVEAIDNNGSATLESIQVPTGP